MSEYEEMLRRVVGEETGAFLPSLTDTHVIEWGVGKLYFISPDGASWDEEGLHKPPVGRWCSARSRRGFPYGMMSFGIVLPSLDPKKIVCTYFGFEQGDWVKYGSILAKWYLLDGVETFDFGAFGWHTRITNLLPPDAKTAEHIYAVKVNRSCAELFIDRELKAVVLAAPGAAGRNVTDGPPYGVAVGNRGASPLAMPVLVELETPEGVEATLPLDYRKVRVSGEDPLPPRAYRLYAWETNSLFAGYTLSAGTLTSHPVPIYGYSSRTILFRADRSSAADGLVVEVLTQTGSWRTYHAETYAANDDWKYIMTGDALLLRVRYTPEAYPAVVAEGEVVAR